MTGKYNKGKLRQHKNGILGLYLEKLEDLKKSKIPMQFELYAGMFKEVIPFFPKNVQSRYQKVLEAGLVQVRYLRAAETVDALEDSALERLVLIDRFLKDN